MSILSSASSNAVRVSADNAAFLRSLDDAANAADNAANMDDAAFTAYLGDFYAESISMTNAETKLANENAAKLRKRGAALGLAILYPAEHSAKLAKLSAFFHAYRDEYAELKTEYETTKDTTTKADMQAIARAWGKAKRAVSHVFNDEGYAAEYPDIRTEKGELILRTKVEQKKHDDAEKADQIMRDANAAKRAQDRRDAAELNAVRSMDDTELTALLVRLIDENGADGAHIAAKLSEHYAANAANAAE